MWMVALLRVLRYLDAQGGSLLCWEGGLLAQAEVLLLPVEFGGDELVDPDGCCAS